jgi:hypothetical protein
MKQRMKIVADGRRCSPWERSIGEQEQGRITALQRHEKLTFWPWCHRLHFSTGRSETALSRPPFLLLLLLGTT